MPQHRQARQPLTESRRLQINSIRFVVDSGIRLAEVARSHRLTGNGRAAALALQGASKILVRAEDRLSELPQDCAEVEGVRNRLLELKRTLQDFGRASTEPS